MKLLCPVRTIISPEEFCQINCISRHKYETERMTGKICRNGLGGALRGDDPRFHNAFDVIHYAIQLAMRSQKLYDRSHEPNDTCDEIIDRIASIVETFKESSESSKLTLVEGCSSDPLLFGITGRTNEAFGVYRRIGETLIRIESVLDGKFCFKLGMSNSLDEDAGKWASNVWIDHCSEHYQHVR